MIVEAYCLNCGTKFKALRKDFKRGRRFCNPSCAGIFKEKVKITTQRELEIRRVYREEGSLRKAAKKLGISHERVRQLL